LSEENNDVKRSTACQAERKRHYDFEKSTVIVRDAGNKRKEIKYIRGTQTTGE